MTSLQAKVDAVKSALPTPSSCTTATVVTLKELLLPESEVLAIRPKLAPPAKAGAARKNDNGASRSNETKSTTTRHEDESLSARDRAALATHVINVTLKSLSEAAKPAPPATPAKRNDEPRQTTGARSLRRSLSAPMSPLQPRTLNRVATSPNLAEKAKKNALTASATACLATVECARVAFAALRSLKGPPKPDQTDFQLENGMSTLVAKLMALGMHEQALKELRVLKKRLESASSPEASQKEKASSKNAEAAPTMAELLEYNGSITEHCLPVVLACQLQVLKLLAATKKASHIESILPILDESHPSSPISLLSRSAKISSKDATKAARQMASVSQILLSLAPSVSTKDDHTATEPRLSVSPRTAFQLQVSALRTQLMWWKVASHKGNVDDDVLSPFLRCGRAFVRRQKPDDNSVYEIISSSFEGLMELIRDHGSQPSSASDSATASIYQLLGSTAQVARQYSEAYRWFKTLKDLLQPNNDSLIRIYSVSARLVAVALKNPKLGHILESLLKEIIDGLDGSLSGTVTDLNELLESLSSARRSITSLLMDSMNAPKAESTPHKLDGLLRAFILRYPRFLRRWLGPAPGKDTSAKHLLQFDQRRQLLLQTIGQALDAALMVVKCDIQSGAMEWNAMDEVLQDCSVILNSLIDPTLPPSRVEKLGLYRVKISSLYFTKFSLLRKLSDRSKDQNKQILQSLSRSIDAVKDSSLDEKEKAQISTKLEVFADLCKGAGRTEDAVRTLRSICRSMADDGILSNVASSLSTQPPIVAWNSDERASTFSRTLRSIAKLDKSWNDWTFFLPELERAAVLEHLMNVNSARSTQLESVNLQDPGVAALLRIYSPERYPVRRFRVLLHLFYQNLGHDHVLEEIVSQLEQTVKQTQKKELFEDASLAQYVPHLQAYHASLRSITDLDTEASTAKDAVSCWKSMLETSEAQQDLYSVIDDPEALLDHLKSTGHLAGLRGHTQLQVSILELVVSLSRAREELADGLVPSYCVLATTYADLGQLPKAMAALERARELSQQQSELPHGVLVDFYISQAEYFARVGDMDEAKGWVLKAKSICDKAPATWARSKFQAAITLSLVSLLQSTLAIRTGDIEGALTHVKSSVRQLSHDWSKLEAITESGSDVDMSIHDTTVSSVETKSSRNVGPKFWILAHPLIRSLLHISSVYSHIGMFQETIYYAESAWKIAESAQSSFYMAQISAWSGSVYFRAGNLDKALPAFKDAEVRMPQEACSFRVELARRMGDFYQEQGEYEVAQRFFSMAEETTRQLNGQPPAAESEPPKKPAVAVKGRRAATRTAAADRTKTSTRAATAAVPKGQKKGAVSKTKPAAAEAPAIPTDVHQASLLAAIILSRAVGYIQQRDWSSALDILQQAKDLPKQSVTLSQEQIVTATSLIGHSMEQMIVDPVFSVLQDSTISIPAVSTTTERGSCDKTSPASAPVRRGRAAATERNPSKDRGIPGFADALKQALELLLQAHSSALCSSESSIVHRVSTLLQSTMVFLSATATKSKPNAQSIFASVAVDLARNVSWQREQATIRVAPAEIASMGAASEVSTDMKKFQTEYVELIPDNWNVISISLSDNDRDLCITKFQSGHSPFILRLPLERANSRDADSEIFNYEHGREELLDIIRAANETSHSARDFTAKGERGAWWAERAALDTRLGELLATIETTWLGGFKGIFSQHERRSDLLARFQKSFQKVLDANLPSRNTKRGKKSVKQTPVTLDPRILDLFIGLGDPTDPDCDFDEALNDLLYFVVDILQFHGEKNAYDEIDFDAMVVETYDALRGYYAAMRGSGSDDENHAHTVLVLDKSLHVFPWESLPCLQGLAVSRVPSLECLRQLIVNMKVPDGQSPAGHYVSPGSGTYILNPSSDLKNTQAFFQPTFRTLKSWTSIINRAPEEAEFEQALTESDIVLYFGHGSGAQYVRGKTIRRLEKCQPATFLMGCSSAALTAAGDFECYGPVWNYMMAGCPAVVGTLWDVTDRDIDRFAGRAFEEWGLFPSGTFKEAAKGKGKGKGRTRSPAESEDEDADSSQAENIVGGDRSLGAAIARARSACRFKYLNAAAVVLYGIPAYIHRGE
ncbi:peptidase family C50-domain-containing protein [Stachybotrys elegans]|uniref:separase n=1 Tax=Stachybotrys elegans TaxID=80388 RepID=A0A8K0SN42_9HYPO|nr:peptidase family C50-domain-containing protein [Stachybotrys elegans]